MASDRSSLNTVQRLANVANVAKRFRSDPVSLQDDMAAGALQEFGDDNSAIAQHHTDTFTPREVGMRRGHGGGFYRGHKVTATQALGSG